MPDMITLKIGNKTYDIRDSRIGNLADLDTTAKNSLVSAINEVFAGRAPTDQQVQEAVDAWLEANISQETGYALDRTLTLENAAAPADLVGDLKSALDEAIEDFAVPTQEAVDNWLAAHPEATTTVQDGSLTESKFSDALKLKTIKDYVTPDMFYEDTDNGDMAKAVTRAIAYANANYLAVRSDKRIYTHTPIVVDSFSVNISLDYVYYDGDDCAILIKGQGNRLSASTVNSAADGIRLENTNDNVNLNQITICSITAQKRAISLSASNKGIAYNRFDLGRVIAGNSFNAIELSANKSGSASAYINENSFISPTVARGLWGIYMKAQNGAEVDNNLFEKPVLEGCENGIYFDKARFCTINKPRIAEVQLGSGIAFSINNVCDGCEVYLASDLHIDKIAYSDARNSPLRPFRFRGTVRLSGSGAVISSTGIKIQSTSDITGDSIGFLTVDTPAMGGNFLEFNGEKRLTDLQIYNTFLTSEGGSLYLSKMYNQVGISDLFINITYNHTLNIYDCKETLACTISGSGWHHVHCYNQAWVPHWVEV